jgi:hypothetical protein
MALFHARLTLLISLCFFALHTYGQSNTILVDIYDKGLPRFRELTYTPLEVPEFLECAVHNSHSALIDINPEAKPVYSANTDKFIRAADKAYGYKNGKKLPKERLIEAEVIYEEHLRRSRDIQQSRSEISSRCFDLGVRITISEYEK